MTQRPFSLIGVDHIVYWVDDMDLALRWYGDVLGCQRGFSYPALGMEQIWAGAALIVLWDKTHPGAAHAVPKVAGGANVDHICLATSPFAPEKLRAHLAAQDVTIEREAHHGGARGQGYSAYIRDPFGNLLELKGPPEYPDGRAAV